MTMRTETLVRDNAASPPGVAIGVRTGNGAEYVAAGKDRQAVFPHKCPALGKAGEFIEVKAVCRSGACPRRGGYEHGQAHSIRVCCVGDCEGGGIQEIYIAMGRRAGRLTGGECGDGCGSGDRVHLSLFFRSSATKNPRATSSFLEETLWQRANQDSK